MRAPNRDASARDARSSVPRARDAFRACDRARVTYPMTRARCSTRRESRSDDSFQLKNRAAAEDSGRGAISYSTTHSSINLGLRRFERRRVLLYMDVQMVLYSTGCALSLGEGVREDARVRRCMKLNTL